LSDELECATDVAGIIRARLDAWLEWIAKLLAGAWRWMRFILGMA
jgi:hypothetical protein